jgi:hypothetical protein
LNDGGDGKDEVKQKEKPMIRLVSVLFATIAVLLMTGCSDFSYPPANLHTTVLDSANQQVKFHWADVYVFCNDYRGFVMKDGTIAKGTVYLNAEAQHEYLNDYSLDQVWVSHKTYRFDVGGDDSSKCISRVVFVHESTQACNILSSAVIRLEETAQGKTERVLYVNLSEWGGKHSTLRTMKKYVIER